MGEGGSLEGYAPSWARGESGGVRAVVGARCAHLEGGHRNGPRGDRDGVARGIKGRHAPWRVVRGELLACGRTHSG